MYLKKKILLIAIFTILLLSLCITLIIIKKKESFLNINTKQSNLRLTGGLYGVGPFSERQRKDITTNRINLKSLKTFCDNKFQKTLNSRVAIVGNGPLYTKDIAKILECNLIIQFNHAEHYHKINRCDILAVRPREEKTDKLSLVNNTLKTIKEETYILPITITNDNIKLFKKNKNKLLKPILIYEDSNKKNSELPGNVSLFNLKEENYQQKNALYGPSSGAALISEIDKIDSIDEIYIFGMNFNGGPQYHLDFKYPFLVKKHCQKCIFHPTPNQGYR